MEPSLAFWLQASFLNHFVCGPWAGLGWAGEHAVNKTPVPVLVELLV